VLAYHVQPEPDVCEVCKYAVEQNLDVAYQHALVRLATVLLLGDLGDIEGDTARFSSLVVSRVGEEPGPVHYLEPYHWYWALFFEPEIGLSRRRQ
jgi:hypothetical protein